MQHDILTQALPSVILVLMYPFVPESPRFLVVQGRIDEAEHCLAKAVCVCERESEREREGERESVCRCVC